MTTRILGFNSGHDASYCILENGIPVLCEELERFSRVKMELGDGLKFFFERHSEVEDINYFTFGNWGSRKGLGAKYTKDLESDGKMKSLISKHYMNIKKLRLIVSLSEKEKFNVAASLQEYAENSFRSALGNYVKGYTNLCLSGGVSLNCVILGKIRQWFPNIKNIFCDPVPYDAGLALGSARYLWHHVLGNPRVKNVQNIQQKQT